MAKSGIPIPATDDPAELRIPATIYPYSAGIKGGLLGGFAMIIVALLYGVISGFGPWYTVNLIAATVIRSWQNASRADMAQFHLNGLLIGLAIHLFTAVLLGFLFAVMMPALPRTPIFWSIIIGPCLWGGAAFAGLPLFNPVMAEYVDPLSFGLANIVYSLVLGIYVARTPKIKASELSLAQAIPWRRVH